MRGPVVHPFWRENRGLESKRGQPPGPRIRDLAEPRLVSDALPMQAQICLRQTQLLPNRAATRTVREAPRPSVPVNFKVARAAILLQRSLAAPSEGYQQITVP
jgi:hypothetical protein